jgi:hypothetical protein
MLGEGLSGSRRAGGVRRPISSSVRSSWRAGSASDDRAELSVAQRAVGVFVLGGEDMDVVRDLESFACHEIGVPVQQRASPLLLALLSLDAMLDREARCRP